MATYTTYYGMEKPAYGDVVDVSKLNDNFDTIDYSLHASNVLGSNIGYEYNPQAPYSVNDYCIYNDVLYKCVQAVPSGGETFNPAKWSMVRVTDELANGGGGGGSEVTWTQLTQSGTKIAEIDIDGTTTNVYAPTSGGASALSGLSDVDLTSPTNGQGLIYDSTNSEWVNGDVGDSVSVTQTLGSGTKVGTVTINGSGTDLYAPTPTDVEANPSSTGSTDLTKLKVGSTTYNIPSGGSTVSVSQTLSSGTEVAGITVNGTETKLYAPTPTNVVANPSGTATTDLTKLTVGSTIYNIPSGGGSGDSVSWTQLTQSGTKIAEIDINGTSTDVYAPTSGGASALSGLSDVTITSAQNNQDLTYDSTSSKWINKTKEVSLTKAQYDALPDTKLTDGITYFITDLNISDPWIDLIGTLTAGSTSLTLSSSLITTDSTIDFYTSIFGVNPTAVSLTTGSITLTFEAQQTDMTVKVRVSSDGTNTGGGGSGSVDIYLTSTVTVTEVNE